MIFIKVLKYKGKSGGFALLETDRWSVSLVNDEIGKEISLNGFMCDGYGYSKRNSAMEVARPYAELLDVPIKEFSN